MTPLKRRAAAMVAPVLLAVSLSACGGGPDAAGAPDDASTEEFCALFEDDAELDSADQASDFAEKMAEVGTPAEITGEAREGFETTVEFLGDVSDDDIKKFDEADDPSALDDIFGGEDEAQKVVAFLTEQATVCNPELELPDVEDLPTELPS